MTDRFILTVFFLVSLFMAIVSTGTLAKMTYLYNTNKEEYVQEVNKSMKISEVVAVYSKVHVANPFMIQTKNTGLNLWNLSVISAFFMLMTCIMGKWINEFNKLKREN